MWQLIPKDNYFPRSKCFQNSVCRANRVSANFDENQFSPHLLTIARTSPGLAQLLQQKAAENHNICGSLRSKFSLGVKFNRNEGTHQRTKRWKTHKKTKPARTSAIATTSNANEGSKSGNRSFKDFSSKSQGCRKTTLTPPKAFLDTVSRRKSADSSFNLRLMFRLSHSSNDLSKQKDRNFGYSKEPETEMHSRQEGNYDFLQFFCEEMIKIPLLSFRSAQRFSSTAQFVDAEKLKYKFSQCF